LYDARSTTKLAKALRARKQRDLFLFSKRSAEETHLFVTKTADHVIVHQASGLHEGVADCRAHEAKPAFQQVFA